MRSQTTIWKASFTLHHADDENRLVLGLRFYLDDSGSDDASEMVACGGLVMSRIDFKHFCTRWAKMYEQNRFTGYALEPPLHMSDFSGSGKYAGLYPEFKRALFRDVAELINAHRLYSLSIAVSQVEFRKQLSEDVCSNLLGPYGFAFFSIVLAHQGLSENLSSGPLKTSYLVDRGFGHQDQLNQAHKLIVDFEKALGGFRHTGALATGSDDDVPALQAADAISWASRKIQLNGALPEGFEPLSEVLREDGPRPHVTVPMPSDGIKMFADPVNKWIAKYGTMPALKDILVRHVNGFVAKLK